MTTRPVQAAMLIGNVRFFAKEALPVHNPARPDEVVGFVQRGEPFHVEAAVAAAREAAPRWAALKAVERAAIIDEALEGILDLDEAVVRRFVRENGKPLAYAAGELRGTVARQRLALSHAAALDEWRQAASPNTRSFVGARPYGVVLSIVPWNAPVSLAMTHCVAALLAGNAVVIKPPETCPLTLIEVLQAFSEKLPAGLVNAVTGLPAEIGDALTLHPGFGKIAFTGGVASGRRIMANAAQRIVPVAMELGGNDPAIFLPDAQFTPRAMADLARATFVMSGQVCMAVKRIYVPRNRHDEFVAAFSEEVDRLVIGDGLDKEVTLGPLHLRASLDRAHAMFADARQAGGRVLELGRVKDKALFERGHFMRPAIVTDIPDDCALVTDEQFCAAVPVMGYAEIDEAIARANNSEFGLSASVWGGDVEQARRVAERIEAGHVWLNAHTSYATDHGVPYGGFKQSGIGLKSGLQGILEFTRSQTITSWEPAGAG